MLVTLIVWLFLASPDLAPAAEPIYTRVRVTIIETQETIAGPCRVRSSPDEWTYLLTESTQLLAHPSEPIARSIADKNADAYPWTVLKAIEPCAPPENS